MVSGRDAKSTIDIECRADLVVEFSDEARVAASSCSAQFQGVDEFGLLMDCRAKSGIDYCQ